VNPTNTLSDSQAPSPTTRPSSTPGDFGRKYPLKGTVRKERGDIRFRRGAGRRKNAQESFAEAPPLEGPPPSRSQQAEMQPSFAQ